MQEVFKIRPNIWHIQDVEGVFFTVLAGEREALVVDSGYGKADHRAFVESLIHTPYLVANSHGHPDHVGGNSQYDTVYVHPADLAMAEKKGSLAADRPVLKPLQEETVYDLGGLHVRVTALPGHTKGTVGFLAEEYRLLIAGDAFNPDMWMFAENHDTLDTLEQTLEKALTLPFDSYLGSHTTKEIPQNFLREALANVRERRVDWHSWEKILGRDTYEIIYQGKYGRSSIRIDEEEALRIQETQERGFYTRLLHGNDDTHFADGATIPPVYQTSAFSHETAQRILKNGCGAILTVRFGTRKKAFQVMDALRISQIVSNIGDNRTLVVHPASTMALHSTEQECEDAGVYDDLVRISVGIENIADIISDFDRALKQYITLK